MVKAARVLTPIPTITPPPPPSLYLPHPHSSLTSPTTTIPNTPTPTIPPPTPPHLPPQLPPPHLHFTTTTPLPPSHTTSPPYHPQLQTPWVLNLLTKLGASHLFDRKCFSVFLKSPLSECWPLQGKGSFLMEFTNV